jgi:hypothetical protein
MEIPMLEEDEWRQVIRRGDDPGAFLAEYNSIVGFNETNPNAIWHHRLSLFGPPYDTLWQASSDAASKTLRCVRKHQAIISQVIALNLSKRDARRSLSGWSLGRFGR